MLYLNLFTLGYNLGDFLCFILKKVECLIGLVGIILVVCSFKKG